jgi:HD-like signal output (HDOD) protein
MQKALQGRAFAADGVLQLADTGPFLDQWLQPAPHMIYDQVPAFTLEPLKKAPPKPEYEVKTSNTPRFIEDVAAGRVELPVIPAIVQQLMAALRNPNVDARQIAQALARDPVLTTKVLRLANSSFFGGQRSMSSVDSAVGLIGIAALNRLVVACGVSSSFEDVQGIDLPLFWRDSRVAANAALKLAARVDADADEAYLCGLLHAVGHLILCRTYPEIAQAMFIGFAPVRGAELAAIEMEAFGIEHPTVGALWVESIKFPKTVADSIGNSLRPPQELVLPLHLSLHGGRTLAAAVAQRAPAEAALAALHPTLRARCAMANGQADAAFMKMYEGLFEAEAAA